jgi:hypothetical protein
VNSPQSLVVEVDGSDPPTLDSFLEDISTQLDTRVLPLDTREPSLIVAFLVELSAGTTLEFARKIVNHFKDKAVEIRIKKGKDKELAISCSDKSFNPSALSDIIEEFLGDDREH